MHRMRSGDLPEEPMRATAARDAAEAELMGAALAQLQGVAYRCRPRPEWTVSFVSDGCEALTGYTRAELVGSRRFDFEPLIHPEDRAAVRRAVTSALAAQRPFEMEYRIVRADGGLRWVAERGSGLRGPDGSVVALTGVIQDVSSRRRAEESLREAERRYRSIFENALEGIFQSTPADGYVTVNPALARMYGYDSPAQLIADLRDIGRQLYVEPGRRAEFMEAMERDGAVAGFESQVYRRDGSIIWISENARAVRDAGGSLLFFEGTVEAITERKRHEALVRHQATHDALTGLPNRLLLGETLAQALGALPDGGLIGLAFVDLDQFKLVNDTLGHDAGDRLLRTVAQRLNAALRPGDLVARLGGDEFVALIRGQSTRAGLQQAAQRLLEAVAQPLEIAGRELAVTCSLGVCVAPADGRSMDVLLRCADAAMYRAKEEGRNTLRFYDSAMSAATTQRLDLLARLRLALQRDEFRLAFEPKCRVADGVLVGAEALLRWHTPAGNVPPGEFIGLAEESGLIMPIGEWVLRRACEQQAAWRAAGLQCVPLSINLSPRQLLQDDFPQRVEAALADTGLAASDIEFEVTESALMRDGEGSIRQLQRLRALGVGLAMDDFGTGHSSLSYLRRLPVECLKIDRSFLASIDDADTLAIVRAIVSLGRELGLRTLAEGVETAGQLELLRRMGCEEFQGWLLGRPQSALEFAWRLR